VLESEIMWTENGRLTKSITSGFERMTSCVTSVIRLDFSSVKSFENVHLVKILLKRIKL